MYLKNVEQTNNKKNAAHEFVFFLVHETPSGREKCGMFFQSTEQQRGLFPPVGADARNG